MKAWVHAHIVSMAAAQKQRVPEQKYAVAPAPWSGNTFDEWAEVQDVARTAIHPSSWWKLSHMNGNGDLLYDEVCGPPIWDPPEPPIFKWLRGEG